MSKENKAVAIFMSIMTAGSVCLMLMGFISKN